MDMARSLPRLFRCRRLRFESVSISISLENVNMVVNIELSRKSKLMKVEFRQMPVSLVGPRSGHLKEWLCKSYSGT